MIEIEETIIRKLILHRVSTHEHKTVLNNELIVYSEEDEPMLKKMLLKPFLGQSYTFEFQHNVDLKYNVLYNLSRQVRKEDFVLISQEIAEHLASVSKHPNIKDGDLFIAKFDDIKFNNKYYEGLGIYKYEDKEPFVETHAVKNEVKLQFKKGIGSKKAEKACLVIFSEKPYTLLIIDSNSNETNYWQEEFINHKAKNDNVNNTNTFLSLTKDFITSQIQNEFEVNRADQIDLLNKSVEYFKTHDQFKKSEFEEQVFEDPNVIDSFRRFNQTYSQENEVDIADGFEISNQAVKKQSRIFKSVLKLDKNFHIYIHGDRNLIEQGVENDGRKYYKIYYKDES